MPNIELIIFDIAGTTVEDPGVVNTVLKETLGAADIQVSFEDVNAFMGITKPLAIRSLADSKLGPGGISDAKVMEIHEVFRQNMIDYYKTSPDVVERPGASELFAFLKSNGIKVALDTGFDRTITDIVIDRLNWRNVLDGSVCSDEVKNGRPHPDMVFEMMSRLGLTEVVRVGKVGDTPSDLGEGQAAGCGLNIGITSGTHTKAQLEGHPHTHLIESLSEIEGIVS